MCDQIWRLLLKLIRRRLKILICICIMLFIINVYVISLYFQLYNAKSKELVLPFEPEPNLSIEVPMLNDTFRSPRCSFEYELSDKAFDRMKTEKCRKKLEEVACNIDPIGWPVHAINNTCRSNFDKEVYGSYRGCYLDNTKKRLLPSFKYVLEKTNSPELCIQYCLRAGFQLAGVEYSTECFCGKEEDMVNAVSHPNETQCEQYACPSNSSLRCGGFNAIAIYNTGVLQRTRKNPAYIELTDGVDRDVKILFLLQLNGRNSRQIRRLLRLLYQPNHFYFIHIDPRQKFMQQEMKEIQILLESQGYRNFHVSEKRFPTIWGGTSLLDMFLFVIKWSFANQYFKSWDYIFNVSESDFPVLSLAELEAILAENKGKSFVSAHGYNTATFLKKQGYNYHFLQCENRMWRFAERTNYPAFLLVDGGSDWVIIHRDFARFSISDLDFPIQMRKLFTSILLPLEGFFHTLSLNTDFCDKMLYNNLRFTNWKRSQGCRCNSLKQVVDWCGCSPLVLLHDEEKVTLNRTISKVNYFARKFESLIDIDAVAKAEEQALRFESDKIQRKSPVFNSTWVNFFDRRFDHENSTLSSYLNLARSLFENASFKKKCGFGDLLQINIYKANRTSDLLLLFYIADVCGVKYELEIFRKHQGEIVVDQYVEGYELKLIEFGMALDLKEEIFRDFVSILQKNGTVVFQFQWLPVSEPAINKTSTTTSPTVVSQLFYPSGTLLKRQRIHPYDSIDNMQHVAFDMADLKTIEIGVYQFVLSSQYGNTRLGTIDFPLFPEQLDSQFHELAGRFYELRGVCVDGSIEELSDCRQTEWSSLFPDLKTQIITGFDENLGSLN